MKMTRKRSKKRDAILACLRETGRHPSAEWIYAQLKPAMPDLSRGTVYRNLRLFLREGMAATVGVVGGLERFDGNLAPHAHFICRGCGAVMDLMDVMPPEALSGQAEAYTGGTVTGCSLTFSGFCRGCAEAGASR